ncbi:MAG: hypothetical protein ISQ85_05905 [Planktomarina sp.]|jgi:hypothetical protein|nr:hypothetical protein [Planktomarina sp.]MBL6846415.1 hypothetical protein [Planktomarina sp.]MDA9099670.1 hypothetical protein [Planktomarina sp.]|tara:strand:+ start:441 stop:719 length:279 start_codon:yes stop_codon:yes gene_type:complete
MKWIIITLAIFLTQSAQAACYADYKAKQENPLKLHYGIMKFDSVECTASIVQKKVALRLLPHGWTLLNLLTVSRKLPTTQRKENAGENFLRY